MKAYCQHSLAISWEHVLAICTQTIADMLQIPPRLTLIDDKNQQAHLSHACAKLHHLISFDKPRPAFLAAEAVRQPSTN